MSTSRIVELGNAIQANTLRVDLHYSSQGLPTPSFDAEAPLEHDLPNDIQKCRQAVVEATDELHMLMLGPIQTVNWLRV